MDKLSFRENKIAINKYLVDIKDIEVIEINRGIFGKKDKFYLTINTKLDSIDCFFSMDEFKVLEIFLKLNNVLKKYNFKLVNQKLINKNDLTSIKADKNNDFETLTICFNDKNYEIYSGYDQNLIERILITCNCILDKNKKLNNSDKELV